LRVLLAELKHLGINFLERLELLLGTCAKVDLEGIIKAALDEAAEELLVLLAFEEGRQQTVQS